MSSTEASRILESVGKETREQFTENQASKVVNMMSSTASGRFSPFAFDSKPPTPPPKDPIYQQQIRLSTAPSSHLMTDGPSSSSASTKKLPLGFFKFPKKSPTRFGELVPPPPSEDEGISLPWNFQHNIHVDEGFIGLPPSWSSSLASQGFTEEEISAVQARRLGARSPQDLRYLYTDRPNSPAPSSLYRRPSTMTTNSSITSSSPAVDSTTSYAAQSPTLSITPTVSSGSQMSVRRNKLALPAADDVMMGHRPNQPSISTVAYSSDSHAPTTSSQSHTTSQSQSSREESALPKEKKSFWGQSRTKPSKEKLSVFSNLVASSSTPNLGGGFPSSKDPHPPPPPVPPPPPLPVQTPTTNPNHQHLFSHSHSQASVSTSSLSLSSSATTLSSTSTPTTWNLKASASSLAAAAVGAVKSSAGKGVLKVLRGKTGGGGSPVSGSSTEADMGSVKVGGGGRGKSKIRMSDETFFALDHEHDQFESGRDTTRPTVWELYMKPKMASGGSGTAGTMKVGQPPTQFVTGTTAAAALAEAAAAAGWSTTRRTAASGSQASSRNGSLHRKGSGGSLTRSKSYGSLRSQRSLGSQASSSSTHTVGVTNATTIHASANTNVNAVANNTQSHMHTNTKSTNAHTHINTHTNTNTIPNAIQKLTTRKQRPHMLGKHKQSGSVTSLESIPEASPAPGAVLGVPGGVTGASSNPHFNHHRDEQNHRLGGGEHHQHSASVASASATSSNSNITSNGLSTQNGTGIGAWASTSSPRPVDVPPPQLTAPSTTPGATTPIAASSTQNPLPPPPGSTAAPRLSLHSGNDSLSLSTWWTEAVLTGMGGKDTDGWGENWSGGQGGGEKEREGRDGPAVGLPNTGWGMEKQKQQRQGRGQPVGGASSSIQSTNNNYNSNSASTSTSTPPKPVLNITNGSHNSRGMSPSRVTRKNGQPLPLSKPPPRHPAPDPPVPAAQAVSMTSGLSSGMGGAGAGQGQDQKQKSMHAQSTVVRINAAIAAASANASMRPTVAIPTTPRPLPTIAAAPSSAPPPLLPSIQGSIPNASNSTGLGCTASNDNNNNNNNPNALPFQSEGLLSPPPTGGWKPCSTPGTGATAGHGGATILSPGSSTGPDSAQLWNEIEQMMDPSMMSTIPGLHYSTALPPGARDVLESARILGGGFGTAVGTGGGADAKHNAGGALKAKDVSLPSNSVTTVGDLVGKSPPGSDEGEHGGNREEEEEDGDGESDESDMLLLDDDPYEGVVQNVIARPSVEPLSLSLRTGRPALTTQAPLLKVSRSRSRGRGQEGGERVDQGLLSVEEEEANRDSIRSSTSTITIAGYASPPRIVRAVSVVRRTGAYVIDKSKTDGSIIDLTAPTSSSSGPLVLKDLKQNTSSPGGSSDGSVFSGSSDSPIQENLTPTTDAGIASPLLYYLDGTQTPLPRSGFDLPGVVGEGHNTRGVGRFEYDEDVAGVSDAHRVAGGLNFTRPTIVINDSTSPIATTPSTETIPLSGATPLSPFQRYRGWLSAVVAPLEVFIDESVDPREHYLDLREIAEGESGSVFAARLNPENAEKLRLEPLVKAQDGNSIASGQTKYVAIKSIAIVPSGSGSPKLADLQRELTVMKGCAWHEHVLGMDAVYVDLVEDSLWVRMELMERSLADLIGLVEEGLMLQDRMIARFAGDVLLALDYLLTQNIAHRDVRSDNLLINQQGILKLVDFSNAVKVSSESPLRDDIAGVAFWQAPEIRRGGFYNALKVDVWSLGATVWEMAQTEPPFADTKQLAERWPPLRQPELHSPAFHEFLRKCSEPAASRPSATELLKSPFVKNACGRPVIIQLLAQCVAIEKSLQDRNDSL